MFTNPKYPVYIISKNRAKYMYTSRSLAKMKVPHYVAVEPHNLKEYEEALNKFKIRDYVTLLELPFQNHGYGSGPARNWCWDHSIENGAEYHWILDDNISDFYRYHKNKRIRVGSGIIFKAAEDFVYRYENVPISGFNYRFFIAQDGVYPAFVPNTRIYSTLLIRNDCKHRWRGKYNEDTDICLRVLKDGNCTIRFNAFLQGKHATQTLKGGNTDEIYTDGTYDKSLMLYYMHPDVTKVVKKYGRWHHHVDYSPFANNILKFKKDIKLKNESNNYGMKLIKISEERS